MPLRPPARRTPGRAPSGPWGAGWGVRLALAVVAAAAIAATALPRDATASAPATAFGPLARANASLVYDARDGYALLFGGSGPTGILGDTWVYEAGAWSERSPSPAPPARAGAAMAYDAKLGYVVLFGGFNATGRALGDTWKFEGGSWTRLSLSTAPSARWGAASAFDGTNGKVLLFGGRGANGAPLADTWAFAKGKWSRLAPSTHPSARFDAALVYDAADGFPLLFGGDNGGSLLADAWKFAAGQWKPLASNGGPSARAAEGLVYDTALGETVLFGGCGFGGPLGDTWVYRAGAWSNVTSAVATAPGARLGSAVAYETPAAAPLLFGGFARGATALGPLNDSWTFGGSAWTDLFPPASPSVTIAADRVVARLGPSFWGVDQGAMYALGTAQSDVVNATPIRYVVWPAGDQADRYDVLQNRFYFDGGNSTVPPESEAAFAGWCRSVGCHAILTVPGEIDNASYAQAEVAYTENTLGFHPDYWQVGNEPARWIHFGLPWSAWNSSQKANATPVSYASAVGAYAAAMRAADPSVRILGLPGVGTGVVGETTWIEATVGLNGPNLSGVSIHVYPAGHASNGNESLATFLGSLTGAASLPARVPADRAAIAAACANCTGVRLFVTEMNSGSVSGLPASSPEVQFVSGYPDVPYIAAQTIQAMALNLTNMDLYALESTYAGSLINGTDGSLRPLYQLYAGLLPHVDDDLVATQLNGAPGGVYAIAAENPAATNMTLLVANANPSASAVLDLAGSGFFAGGAGGAWTLDSSSPLPVRTEWAANAPSAWTVPPLGVALLVGSVPVAMPGLALLADP